VRGRGGRNVFVVLCRKRYVQSVEKIDREESVIFVTSFSFPYAQLVYLLYEEYRPTICFAMRGKSLTIYAIYG